jgi:coenzyme F420-0:L-glutamate ligase/coenzyme F420-1:gamma-L-glutamate ligase
MQAPYSSLAAERRAGAPCNIPSLRIKSLLCALMKKRSTRASRRKNSLSLPASIELLPVSGMPEIRKGDDLARRVVEATRRARFVFEDGDLLVIAQKVVSKAEGRLLHLSTIKPSPHAVQLAAKLSKNPRLVEVILRESRRVVRSDPVLIVETRHGFVCANAGVDQSNVPGRDVVSLLPRNPDRSARLLAVALRKRTGARIAVIISDTFGRPWRLGLTNVAIGAAGVPVLLDLRGTRDLHHKPLHATILAVADELAAAAGLIMGKSAGIPAVVIRGYRYRPTLDPAARIIRPAHEDLFR